MIKKSVLAKIFAQKLFDADTKFKTKKDAPPKKSEGDKSK